MASPAERRDSRGRPQLRSDEEGMASRALQIHPIQIGPQSDKGGMDLTPTRCKRRPRWPMPAMPTPCEAFSAPEGQQP